VLSLLFNSTSPSAQYAREETSAAPYFHRGRAADLVALFETRFPNSPRRAGMNATLIATYAAYGESDAVIDRGGRFLSAFAEAPERTAVTLAMADAYARKERVTTSSPPTIGSCRSLRVVPIGCRSAPAPRRPRMKAGSPRASDRRNTDACSTAILRASCRCGGFPTR